MNTEKFLGFVIPSLKTPSVCESCGDEFTCGASLKGCWCMDLQLTDKSREELKKKFDDCLCPSCLKEFAEPESPEIVPD